MSELKENLSTVKKVLLLEQKYKVALFFLFTLIIIFLEMISLSLFIPFLDILFSLVTNSSISFSFSEQILKYFINYNTIDIIIYLSIFLNELFFYLLVI